MPTHEHETDPSTPGAKRPDDRQSAAERPAIVHGPAPRPTDKATRVPSPPPPPPGRGQHRNSLRGRPTTDPGVAPPPAPLPVPREPMGIIVPSVVAGSTWSELRESGPGEDADDSIDVLLEGIARDQPDSPRGASPTDAPSRAARATDLASRRLGNDEPKVVIARAALGQTGRPERPVGPNADSAASTESIDIGSQPLAPRIVIAVVAGLVVVTAIFVALQRTSREGVVGDGAGTMAPVPAMSASPSPGAAAPPVAPSEIRAAVVAPEASEGPLAVAMPTAPAASSAPRRGAPAGKPTNKSRPRASGAPKPSGADLGEFKGSF
jgi:hypothetical protein